MTNDSKPPSLLNAENAQRFAETMARLGAQYRERMLAGAEQAGKAFAKMIQSGRDPRG